MRTLGGVAIGFAAGVLALGLFLYSTGKLRTEVQTAALPTPAPPDPTMPAAPPVTLPAPPNPALTAPPPEAHAMPVNGSLAAAQSTGGIALPLANLKKEAIQDTFDDTRGGGTKHEATDIMAPRGTPVMAVVDGTVMKLFNSKKGGITVYQYDNQQTYCYYYAHLDRYADGLKEGMLIHKGDVLGYVGSTGDAQAANPHLHFAILQLGADKKWYEHTTAVNPYPLLMHAFALK